MYKVHQTKNKTTETIRTSLECRECLKDIGCSFKKDLAVFEKIKNVEVDCWMRKTYPNLFCTGLHKPMFLQSKSPFTGNITPIHKWVHILNTRFDVTFEKYLNN